MAGDERYDIPMSGWRRAVMSDAESLLVVDTPRSYAYGQRIATKTNTRARGEGNTPWRRTSHAWLALVITASQYERSHYETIPYCCHSRRRARRCYRSHRIAVSGVTADDARVTYHAMTSVGIGLPLMANITRRLHVMVNGRHWLDCILLPLAGSSTGEQIIVIRRRTLRRHRFALSVVIASERHMRYTVVTIRRLNVT